MVEPDKRGLFKRLTEALFEDVEQAAMPAGVTTDPDKPAPTRAGRHDVAHAQFQSRIDALLLTGEPAVAGKIQFVDLDAIRAELGDRWTEIAGKAREITERTIQRRLAPDDAMVP